MPDCRTLDDVTVAYFSQYPDEIDAFLREAFADYAQDGDSAALLSTLRVVARVKGVSVRLVQSQRLNQSPQD